MYSGYEADWAKITAYASNFIRTKDGRIKQAVLSSLGKDIIWPEPLIHATPPSGRGETID